MSDVNSKWWITPDDDIVSLGEYDTHGGWLTHKYDHMDGEEAQELFREAYEEGYVRVVKTGDTLYFVCWDLSSSMDKIVRFEEEEESASNYEMHNISNSKEVSLDSRNISNAGSFAKALEYSLNLAVEKKPEYYEKFAKRNINMKRTAHTDKTRLLEYLLDISNGQKEFLHSRSAKELRAMQEINRINSLLADTVVKAELREGTYQGEPSWEIWITNFSEKNIEPKEPDFDMMKDGSKKTAGHGTTVIDFYGPISSTYKSGSPQWKLLSDLRSNKDSWNKYVNHMFSDRGIYVDYNGDDDSYFVHGGGGLVEGSKKVAAKNAYCSRVLSFIDYPWQEDTEIDFVRMLNEYRIEISNDPTGGATQRYLREMDKENGHKFGQFVSDAFLNAWQDLLGGGGSPGAMMMASKKTADGLKPLGPIKTMPEIKYEDAIAVERYIDQGYEPKEALAIVVGKYKADNPYSDSKNEHGDKGLYKQQEAEGQRLYKDTAKRIEKLYEEYYGRSLYSSKKFAAAPGDRIVDVLSPDKQGVVDSIDPATGKVKVKWDNDPTQQNQEVEWEAVKKFTGSKVEGYKAEKDTAFDMFFNKGNRWSSIVNDLKKLYPELTKEELESIKDSIKYQIEQNNIQIESSKKTAYVGRKYSVGDYVEVITDDWDDKGTIKSISGNEVTLETEYQGELTTDLDDLGTNYTQELKDNWEDLEKKVVNEVVIDHNRWSGIARDLRKEYPAITEEQIEELHTTVNYHVEQINMVVNSAKKEADNGSGEGTSHTTQREFHQGDKQRITDKAPIRKSKPKKSPTEMLVSGGNMKRKADSTDVGSGKLPNQYYVVADDGFFASVERGFYDWAPEFPEFKEFSLTKGEEFGPFNSYPEAREKAMGIYESMGDEPEVGKFNSVSIEDHMTGEIASAGFYAKKGKYGWKFHKDEHEDTEFTSKALGFDIRQGNPKGDEVEASKKTAANVTKEEMRKALNRVSKGEVATMVEDLIAEKGMAGTGLSDSLQYSGILDYKSKYDLISIYINSAPQKELNEQYASIMSNEGKGPDQVIHFLLDEYDKLIEEGYEPAEAVVIIEKKHQDDIGAVAVGGWSMFAEALVDTGRLKEGQMKELYRNLSKDPDVVASKKTADKPLRIAKYIKPYASKGELHTEKEMMDFLSPQELIELEDGQIFFTDGTNGYITELSETGEKFVVGNQVIKINDTTTGDQEPITVYEKTAAKRTAASDWVKTEYGGWYKEYKQDKDGSPEIFAEITVEDDAMVLWFLEVSNKEVANGEIEIEGSKVKSIDTAKKECDKAYANLKTASKTIATEPILTGKKPDVCKPMKDMRKDVKDDNLQDMFEEESGREDRESSGSHIFDGKNFSELKEDYPIKEKHVDFRNMASQRIVGSDDTAELRAKLDFESQVLITRKASAGIEFDKLPGAEQGDTEKLFKGKELEKASEENIFEGHSLGKGVEQDMFKEGSELKANLNDIFGEE